MADSRTTRSHAREVLGQPELPMLLIHENSDSNNVAATGQDILAMTIIGWLFAHHGLMQTQRSVDSLIAGFSNILCRPRPVDSLLSFAIAKSCLSWQLVGESVCCLHGQIVLPGAVG